MPCNQELHAFAEDQLIAHALAIAVTRVHQDLQQIVPGRLLAAPFDVFVQNAVGTGAHFLVPAQFAGGRKPGIEIGLDGLANHELLDDRNGPADKADVVVLQVGAQ